VPEISRFLGIVIGMYYKEHNPPHFHAYYGENEAAIVIQDVRSYPAACPAEPWGTFRSGDRLTLRSWRRIGIGPGHGSR
jgi:hypothetical protein